MKKGREPKDWRGVINRDGDRLPSNEQIRKECFKDDRQLLRQERGRATQRYCKKHKVFHPVSHRCFRMHVSASMPRTFRGYWDPNIGPKTHKGLPVFVRSAEHKRQLLKANGLKECG